ncbi:ABC transporter permease [Paenalcaligenes niemegkensis]|uniref:ABC transporter permease n=1 Tax=Paenalcaligenes niemegkensis TaxID=2895469 RepID=UPI001EE81DFF|nr:ABC transporter permease [Paenalcaligenes niemegkensis]MCQ9617997.1 ABC transporter permease [Paenalcaligenes niemegkensis]
MHTEKLNLDMPQTKPGRIGSLNKLTLFSLLGLGLIVLSAIFAELLSMYDPLHLLPRHRLQAPGAEHWFGADGLGRDVFARVLHGGRISLLVGAGVALIAAVGGVVVGLCAGVSRYTDSIVMRIMDGIMAIPGILLAVALVSLFGASLSSIVIAIAIPEIPRVARLLRSVVLTTREEIYVKAAEGLGLPIYKIMWRHILPSCIAPLVVQTTFVFASAILMESVLGFLGVGFSADVPTWGNVMAEGRAVFQRAPWIILFPGIFLSLTVLSVNILGDSLRDRLDPKLSNNSKVL